MVKPYYEEPGITIYCGDCRTILPHLGPVDVVITDPPYGVHFRGNGWDREVPAWLEPARRIASVVLFTTAPLTLWDYPKPDWVICWARPASNSRSLLCGGFNHWTPIIVYGTPKFPVDFISLHAMANADDGRNPVPTPKPERLLTWLIANSSSEGALVCDPFCGGGTTLVAAKNLGRKAIGIEIEEKYCEIAVNRLRQGVLLT